MDWIVKRIYETVLVNGQRVSLLYCDGGSKRLYATSYYDKEQSPTISSIASLTYT
jgi:hypothetical protein